MGKLIFILGAAFLAGCAPTLKVRPLGLETRIALLPCPYFASRVGDELDAVDESKRNPTGEICTDILAAFSEFMEGNITVGNYRGADSTGRLLSDSGYQDRYYQAFAIGMGKGKDANTRSRSGHFRMELEDPHLAALLKSRFNTRYAVLPIGNVSRLLIRGNPGNQYQKMVSNDFLVGLYDLEGDSTVIIEELSGFDRKEAMTKALRTWYGMKPPKTVSPPPGLGLH